MSVNSWLMLPTRPATWSRTMSAGRSRARALIVGCLARLYASRRLRLWWTIRGGLSAID